MTKGTHCAITIYMKYFNWNNEKSRKLKRERGISFEEVVFYIEKGHILDIFEHPDKKRYSNQKIFAVKIEKYVYLVPFVENDKEVFLKTIIPSRKATRHYLKGEDNNG